MPAQVKIKADSIRAALESMKPKHGGNPRYTMSKDDTALLIRHRERGLSWRQLAKAFAVSPNTVRRIYEESMGPEV